MVSERSEQERVHRDRIIQVLGYYGRHNLGDEFFRVVIPLLFGYPEALFFIQPSQFFDSVDMTVLGGGDVIKPYYLNSIPKEQPYYILGAGLGYESELDLIGSNAKEIFLRNRIDANEAQRRGFNAHYCPDLAFINTPETIPVKPRDEKKKMLVILANSAVTPAMGFNEISDIYYQDYMKWELAKALDVLGEWYDIDFKSMSDSCYAYDSVMAMEVASRMVRGYKGAVGRIWLPIDFWEYDLVISMKFHGLVFSTMWGTPFVNIGLTRKTELYCREAGLTDLMVEPFSLTKNRLLDAVKRAEAEGVSDRLVRLAQERKAHWLSTLYHRVQAWI
jgi:hypothetical protein